MQNEKRCATMNRVIVYSIEIARGHERESKAILIARVIRVRLG